MESSNRPRYPTLKATRVENMAGNLDKHGLGQPKYPAQFGLSEQRDQDPRHRAQHIVDHEQSQSGEPRG